MSQTDVDVKASASKSALVASVSASVETSWSKNEQEFSEEENTKISTFQRGGEFVDSNTQWMKSVQEQPQPLEFELQVITEIIEETIPGVDEQRESLDKFLDYYC